jgi:C1A family cysteine protease
MNRLFRLLLPVIALAAGAAAVTAQPASTLSPVAKYEHKPTHEYGRGRVAHPHLALSLAATPKAEFPVVNLKAYDARADGKITPPFRNQRQCGSCWDFSGIRTIAYARSKFNLQPFQLSEQYILDCVQSGGCNGDDNTTVLKAAKAKGVPADTDYPSYQGSEGRCRSSDSTKLVTIKDYVLVDGEDYNRIGDTQKIKNAIHASGAVGCAVAAGPSWNGYSSGVHRGNSTRIDHDVVLTGWQDDPSIPEGGWWWMDNSWGEEWGIGGRMKIAYGADSIGTEPVAVIVDAPPPPPAPPLAQNHRVLILVVGSILVLVVVGGIGIWVGKKYGTKL